MDGSRDLARDELWLQSLERSRARRAGAPVQLPAPPARRVERHETRRGARRRAVPAAAALLVLTLVVAVLAGALGGSSSPTARVAARVQPVRPEQGGPTYPTSGGVAPISGKVLSGRAPASAPRKCQAAVGSSNYFNPLAASKVTPERIDQGVDYAGTGALGAIGAARINYLATSGSGWPGAFIEYRLLDGTDAGCYVFYAEGVKPVPGLRVGQIVGPGQPVATLIPGWSTGIELGWGAGFNTVTYAAAKHQWSAHSDAHSVATPAGKSFSALIHALGGPAGKLEG